MTSKARKQNGKEPQATVADQWLVRLKNNKAIAAVIVVGFMLGLIVALTTAIQGIRQFIREVSEPLKIQGPVVVIPEPWYYLIFPYPPNPGQKPIPMWLMFYVTLHNTSDKSIWISDYSVSAKRRDRWTQLTPPRQPIIRNTLFFLPGGSLSAVKPACTFSYNAANTPIPRDGYVSGWMFFESRITDRVYKLEFEFHDKEGKLHRKQVNAVNAVFGGKQAQSAIESLETRKCEFEENPAPLTPELQAYMSEMFQYMSIYPWMRPKP